MRFEVSWEIFNLFNPRAPIEGVEGSWVHSAEMRASTRLPWVLARFGLLPAVFDGAWGTDGLRPDPRALRKKNTDQAQPPLRTRLVR